MRTRERVAARFYKSSDRTHITPIRWRKKEREEWIGQMREMAARARASMNRHDYANALAILFQLERLESNGVSCTEHLDVRRAYMQWVDALPKTSREKAARIARDCAEAAERI